MEKSKDRLFELRQNCSRGDHSATEPKSDPQAKTPAIGNRHQFLDLIDEPLTTLAVAVEGIVDLLYIPPNKGQLRLELVGDIIDRHWRPQLQWPPASMAALPGGLGQWSFRGSSSPPDNPDAARSEAECLGFIADLNAALAGRFVSRNNLARHVGIGVSTDDFPPAFFVGAVPRFELHYINPVIVHERFASVGSGVAGATIVNTSPALKAAAEFIVKVATLADASNTIVPTVAPFF